MVSKCQSNVCWRHPFSSSGTEKRACVDKEHWQQRLMTPQPFPQLQVLSASIFVPTINFHKFLWKRFAKICVLKFANEYSLRIHTIDNNKNLSKTNFHKLSPFAKTCEIQSEVKSCAITIDSKLVKHHPQQVDQESRNNFFCVTTINIILVDSHVSLNGSPY